MRLDRMKWLVPLRAPSASGSTTLRVQRAIPSFDLAGLEAWMALAICPARHRMPGVDRFATVGAPRLVTDTILGHCKDAG